MLSRHECSWPREQIEWEHYPRSPRLQKRKVLRGIMQYFLRQPPFPSSRSFLHPVFPPLTGVRNLYRGILAPLSVEPIKRAVKFSANETYSNWCGRDQKGAFLAGTLTGMTVGFIQYDWVPVMCFHLFLV